MQLFLSYSHSKILIDVVVLVALLLISYNYFIMFLLTRFFSVTFRHNVF